MSKKIDNYNPNYPYQNKNIKTEKSKNSYPIIERTNNGLLFPEGPKNSVDLSQLKPDD